MTDFEVNWIVDAFTKYGIVPTDPQAMALVKKLRLNIIHDNGVTVYGEGVDAWSSDGDINEAVVKCVAKMRKATHVINAG